MSQSVKYTASNSYETLNRLGEGTRSVWFVFHGMGYLSRFFLSHFKELASQENYFVAPQAPAKYYLDQKFQRVGASWLTKEDTENEIRNVLNYLDAVREAEAVSSKLNFNILGFSQGVSIAARWVARRKINCHKLVLYAGGIPKELKAGDFNFLNADSRVYQVFGDRDPYLNSLRLEKEKQRFEELFGDRGKAIEFEGGHEIKPAVLKQLIDN